MVYGRKKELRKDKLRLVNHTYREPITIQKKATPTQNEDGTWSKSDWQDWKTVFANASNLHGQEYFVAGQTNKQETVKFYIPFMEGVHNEVKEEYRILFRGKTYNIDFVDNIRYENKELEIKAEERSVTDGTV